MDAADGVRDGLPCSRPEAPNRVIAADIGLCAGGYRYGRANRGETLVDVRVIPQPERHGMGQGHRGVNSFVSMRTADALLAPTDARVLGPLDGRRSLGLVRAVKGGECQRGAPPKAPLRVLSRLTLSSRAARHQPQPTGELRGVEAPLMGNCMNAHNTMPSGHGRGCDGLPLVPQQTQGRTPYQQSTNLITGHRKQRPLITQPSI